MKTTMLMLLSLLFVFAFTNQASAQDPFEDLGTYDCHDYDDGGWLAVDTVDCYEILVYYCYKYDFNTGEIALDFGKTYYRQIYDNCYIQDFIQYLADHHDELLEKHTKKIIAAIAKKIQLTTLFCNEGVFTIVDVYTAACASTELVPFYAGGSHEDPPKVYYWRPKCSEDSRCKTIYRLCWYWDGEHTDLQSRLSLIGRQIDMDETCPDTFMVDQPGSPRIEVECKTFCH